MGLLTSNGGNIDPVVFAKVMWPHVDLYSKQREVLYSVWHNKQTFVVAGNELGKDFVAGLICLWGFLTHKEARIITTSVKDDHLRVLWGEIGRFIQTCAHPLDHREGGPLIINHRDIRKMVSIKGKEGAVEDKISYLRGMVSEKGEGMAGHHAAYTLGVIDEASGVDDITYDQMITWADHVLAFGNPNECQNFFRKAVKRGDIKATYK